MICTRNDVMADSTQLPFIGIDTQELLRAFQIALAAKPDAHLFAADTPCRTVEVRTACAVIQRTKSEIPSIRLSMQ
jgi:hypothetical protein